MQNRGARWVVRAKPKTWRLSNRPNHHPSRPSGVMWPRARATCLVSFAGIAAAIGLGACEQILNVEGIEIVRSDSPDASDTPPGESPLPCQPGQLRCEGVALQLCNTDGLSFRTVRVCSTPELCCADPDECDLEPGCKAPACARGDFRCAGADLEICNDAQTGWRRIDTCASPIQCNASRGHCTDQPCDAVAREYQCSEATLQQCLPNRSDWALTDQCPSHALCNATTNRCEQTRCRIGASLAPSPFLCVGGDLLRCNDAQTDFEYVETCLNAANCNALIDKLVGNAYTPFLATADLEELGCSPASCAPGHFSCQGAQLRRCNADRTGYVTVEICATPAHCNASRGACQPDPCELRLHQCSGDEFQVCTSAGWQLEETCSSGAQCDAAAGCEPPACGPNEYRCDGADLVRCNVERSGWIPVRSCASDALCNVAAKRCDPPVCAPGQRRCNPEARLEECSPGGERWDLLTDCVLLGTLPAGSDPSALCNPTLGCQVQPTCPTNALRCNGQFLERCRNDAWRPYLRCATAAACDESGTGSCLTPVCQPGAHRCVASEANPLPPAAGASLFGLTLQVCNRAGTGYDLVTACGQASLCDADHGQCDICDPNESSSCSGNDILVCSADGQERTLDRVCPAGCVGPGSTTNTGASPLTRATCL